MDKDIDRGLKAFVATLQGPLGQIPFERAVMRHLPLFLDLRRRGPTRTSIAGLLRARDVHPISRIDKPMPWGSLVSGQGPPDHRRYPSDSSSRLRYHRSETVRFGGTMS
jgi:hypothetical protein